ncbi:DUF5130 family protein [Nocardioides dongxiaopingii]|uniref:DUF5130 family protein n=1 Tax=Nocardioides TaxID=1839 RepID=UPI0010C76EC7|nr:MULTISPECIES: DUF5130 family protein [Nocardioides]QCW49955.1 DUF5130 family protein [Nocardioides sp. S-1144]
MPAGEYLSEADRSSLDVVMRKAEQTCRAEFSIFVGRAQGEPRAFATSLHNSMVAPARSILIMVDPDARSVEVVTGGFVRETLTDAQVELATATMAEAFADGDLVGGLRHGIRQLGEHARTARPRKA